MKHKAIFLSVLLLLVLTSCALAQPEAETGDQFAGLYVVPGPPDSRPDLWDSEANPHLTARGSIRVEAGQIGGLDLPQYVLFGEKQGDAYVFPGLEGGYSLFLLRGTTADGTPLSEVVSDMAPGEYLISVSDEGTSDTISGTLYYGPPLGAADWDPYGNKNCWTAYRVYQTPDGRVYLDSVSVCFEGGTYNETSTQRVTTNGEVTENTLSVTVTGQAVPRLERLVVTQFSGDNAALSSQEISLQDPLPAFRCGPDAAWVLVEEHSREGVVRTALPAPEASPISHQVILLDEAGQGRPVSLEITQ